MVTFFLLQMGQLFTQMATLVMEQGETLTRIEDDVEIGLANVVEGHQNLVDFSNVTKGNRGLIIKVFLLLVFFILVFLVWT